MKKKQTDYIHYSNCFEDADTLLSVIDENAQTALSIASAGDNCLALLCTNIDKLVIFDRDHFQLCLTKLKFAAFKVLEYEELLEFLGIIKGNSAIYCDKVFAACDSETVKYFRDNILLITKTKLIHSGRFEGYFQKFRKYILNFTQSKKNVDKFMTNTETGRQREFYNQKINNRRWRFVIKRFFSSKTLAKKGRDKDFFKYADGDLSKHIIDRFLLCIDNVPNSENPYLNYAVYNEFRCLPRYLQPADFKKIKCNLHKAVFIKGTLTDVAAHGIKFDFFNLSDIFEYMSAEETAAQEAIISDIANPGANIIFWNMMVERSFQSACFQQVDSTAIFEREKAYFYQALNVYLRKD